MKLKWSSPEQLDIFYFEIEERLKDIEKDHEVRRQLFKWSFNSTT